MNERCRKKSLVREHFLLIVHQVKPKIGWNFSNQMEYFFITNILISEMRMEVTRSHLAFSEYIICHLSNITCRNPPTSPLSVFFSIFKIMFKIFARAFIRACQKFLIKLLKQDVNAIVPLRAASSI